MSTPKCAVAQLQTESSRGRPLGRRTPWKDSGSPITNCQLALLAIVLVSTGAHVTAHGHDHHHPDPPQPWAGNPILPAPWDVNPSPGGGGAAPGGGGSSGGGTVTAESAVVGSSGQTPGGGGGGGGGAAQGGNPQASAGGNAGQDASTQASGGGAAQGGGGQQSAQNIGLGEGFHMLSAADRIYGERIGGGGDPTGPIDLGQPLQTAQVYYDPDQPLDIAIETRAPRLSLSQGDAEDDMQASEFIGSIAPRPAVTPYVVGGQTVYVRPQQTEAAIKQAYPNDFYGLSASDNIAVNQKLTEPPDLGLCVGNGVIIELVNSAYSYYSAVDGHRIGGPYSLYTLFKVPTNASMTDPGCIYDSQDSKRFFISIQWYEKYRFSYQIIVVSKSSDVGDGFNGVFAVDTSATAPGLAFTSCQQNSGCLGDYPTYGMDSAAFWFGVNEYTFTGSKLAGAILYGVRKKDLLVDNALSRPAAVVFKNFTVFGIKMGFTVQPANCQTGSAYDLRNGGTQYAISSASFYRTNVSSLVTWAIVNTSIIAEGFPGSENPYIAGVAVLATQGLNSPSHEFGEGIAQVKGGNDLDSKDERMQQVVYGDGYLWTNMQTAINIVGVGPSSAVAWFKVYPDFGPRGEYLPQLVGQGYARIAGNNVINGAMAVNVKGNAVLSFSVVGPDYNYSAGYMVIPKAFNGSNGPDPAIVITKLGDNPLYGFSKPIRNGDYTNAVVADDGSIWVGAQFAVGKVYTTSSGYKQNWGTFMSQVNPNA